MLSDLSCFYLGKKTNYASTKILDYEKESIMLIVDDPENSKLVEFDDGDLDDLIIALVDLKNELIAIRNIGNN